MGRLSRSTWLVAIAVVGAACSSGDPGDIQATGERTGQLSSEPRDLAELKEAAQPSPDIEQSPPAAMLERGSIVIGWLEESRLVALPADRLIKAARRNARGFKASLVSPVVGAPLEVVARRGELMLGASNHTELVRLRADWRHPETLGIRRVLRSGEADIEYGSLVPGPRQLLVSVGYAESVAILDVDLDRWVVRRSRTYSDRSQNFPPACLTSDGTLALLSSARNVPTEPATLDLIDPDTLERRKSITLSGGSPGSLTCAGDELWISDFERPRGQVFRSSGEKVGSFAWRGRGSFDIFFFPEERRIYGSDPFANVVYSCRVDTRACQTSPSVGEKPTDLLVVEGHLFVALESSQEIAMLDADTLDVEGRVAFPGSPRTLTYVR